MAQALKSREERIAERQAFIEARRAEIASRPEPSKEEKEGSLVRQLRHIEDQIARLQERKVGVQSQLDAISAK